ncbi:MAG: DUF58 domain-containing protein [Leptospirillia bacterium]
MIPGDLLKRVRQIELATRRKVTSRFSGGYLSTFRGQGMEFDEVREYQPGDDVRAIDWNVTARTGHPYIKRFVTEREMAVVLVVDVSASLDFGSGERTKRALTTELCTLLAFLALGNQDRVGLVLASDRVERYIQPGKGRKHLYRVIRELFYHEPEGRGTDLAAAVEFGARIAPRHSTLFVVSDFLLPGGARSLESAVSKAALRHDAIAVSIGDPREDALPPVGLLEAEDPETGETVVVDTLDRRFREQFESSAREAREAYERMFARYGVDHVPIRTGVSYMEPLMRFFRARARRLR